MSNSRRYEGKRKRTARSETPSWPRALVTGAVSAAPGVKERYDGAIRTVAVAFFANLVVAITKYVGFLLVRSSALLAEAIHSTAVTINQGLMLRGHLSARRPATPDYSFGFGRERYFWGYMVSVIMFGFGAFLSCARGVWAILSGEHHAMEMLWVPYGALTVGLVMDGTSLIQALYQSHREKGKLNYWTYVKRSRNPEVPIVMMEDSAAMVGLFFAYTGITATVVTGNNLYDGIASICIGVTLAGVASILAWKMKSMLIGESALPEERNIISEMLESPEEVEELIYMRSMYLAPDDLLIEAKVRMKQTLRFPEIIEIIERMEEAVRERLPHAHLISIEPDVYRSGDVETPGYR